MNRKGYRGLKAQARSILKEQWRWSDAAVGRALNPTRKQAAERPPVSIKSVALNPERIQAVRILHLRGWSIPDIAEALGVSERKVSRYVSVMCQIREMIEEISKLQNGDE